MYIETLSDACSTCSSFQKAASLIGKNFPECFALVSQVLPWNTQCTSALPACLQPQTTSSLACHILSRPHALHSIHLPFCSPPSMAPENGTLRGSCLCESVKFELKGEPTGLGKFICHCKHCKKASGSTYMANWFFDKKVTIPHHPDALIRSPLTDRDRHTPHFTAKRMSPLTRTTDLTLAGY